DGTEIIGSAGVAGGTATFTTTDLGGGAHTITATYGGDVAFAASSSAAVAQSVAPAATTSALSSSANPAHAGDSITLTIAVTSASGMPDGTATVLDGNTAIGDAQIDKGAGSLIATLDAGTHSLTVAYRGGDDYAASVSPALSQVVAGVAT